MTVHCKVMRDDSCPETPLAERCCGNDLSIVALTRDDSGQSRVDLVRCSACGVSGWLLDGAQVSKEDALGAISAAYSRATGTTVPSAAPARRPAPAIARRTAQPRHTATPSAELSDLLEGWQVLGSH
ncbi:MAG: hypothetical protein NVS3B26_09950 [Mycobacteriales bacterium]